DSRWRGEEGGREKSPCTRAWQAPACASPARVAPVRPMPADAPIPRLAGLSALLAARPRPPPPVEAWDPPYCGDIGMKIGATGEWFYQESPITRAALVRLFASVLRRDADGAHYLVTPVEKVLVTVEDAPFLAVEMDREGTGPTQTLHFRTNVDDVV